MQQIITNYKNNNCFRNPFLNESKILIKDLNSESVGWKQGNYLKRMTKAWALLNDSIGQKIISRFDRWDCTILDNFWQQWENRVSGKKS